MNSHKDLNELVSIKYFTTLCMSAANIEVGRYDYGRQLVDDGVQEFEQFLDIYDSKERQRHRIYATLQLATISVLTGDKIDAEEKIQAIYTSVDEDGKRDTTQLVDTNTSLRHLRWRRS